MDENDQLQNYIDHFRKRCKVHVDMRIKEGWFNKQIKKVDIQMNVNPNSSDLKLKREALEFLRREVESIPRENDSSLSVVSIRKRSVVNDSKIFHPFWRQDC